MNPPENIASDIFQYFSNANTMKNILGLHREICSVLNIVPTRFNDFYPVFRNKLINCWKAQGFFKKIDARAATPEYKKGTACETNRVLIIGAGPCGLRAAIELQLLGAKVVLIEKRDRITRNNVVHLWPHVITDLRGLGAKKFYGKFCAGSIDHVSIRQLQYMMLKMALCLGVEIHEGVEFVDLIEPTTGEHGWRARVAPEGHAVSNFEFDCLVGADGRRNTLPGFPRKEFRGKMALAITANFINKKTKIEAAVPEISGVSYIFKQKFFQDMLEATGIDLENIVYYKDETHYFVMTAKKQSLLQKGVLKTDSVDVNKLLSPSNMNISTLYSYAREAATYATENALPQYEFALNHYGKPDVALFDFTSVYAADNASRVMVAKGHKLLVQLVGDSLVEPFWPTGSGIGRGFLSVLDAAWTFKNWGEKPDVHPTIIVSEREAIYRYLAQTTPNNLQPNHTSYTINPTTRYKTVTKPFTPHRVSSLYSSDSLDFPHVPATVSVGALLKWAALNVSDIRDLVQPENVITIVQRYRPDLVKNINGREIFKLLLKFYDIPCIKEDAEEDEIIKFVSRIYQKFKGEVPYVSRVTDIYGSLKREKKLAAPHFTPLSVTPMTSSPDRKTRKRRVQHSLPPSPHGFASTSVLETTLPEGTLDISVSSTASDVGSVSNERDENRGESRVQMSRLNVKDRATSFANLIKGAESTPRLRSKEELQRSTSFRVKERAEEIAKLLKMGESTPRTPRASEEMKPKDLLRSVGKIRKDDWNVKEIEKKIEENRMGRPTTSGPLKVPKWDKEQFLRNKRRLTTSDLPDQKFQAVDETIDKMNLKLRDSGRPEQGTKKVSRLATMFVPNEDSASAKPTEPAKKPRKSWQGVKVVSVVCAVCNRRVFEAESLVADGTKYHKSCFRCRICGCALRPGCFTFDKNTKTLTCQKHTKQKKISEIYPASTIEEAEPLIILPTIRAPERVSSIDIADEGDGEIDEDEWTDRNFLASGTSEADKSGYSSDNSFSESLSYSSAEDIDNYLPIVDASFRQQTNYTSDDWYGDDDYSGEGAESSERDSGSRINEAREARLQELPADLRNPNSDTSEAESETETESSSSSSSATAVSTDSEFEDETVAIPEPPAITVTHVTPAPIQDIIHQREIQYPLNRAKSSGGIATRRALELKRRYLLGETVQPAVRKSDSTSRLDTKLEAFQSTITEFQKLLNPAPVQETPRTSTIIFQSLNQRMPDVLLNIRKEPDIISKSDVSIRCPNGNTENNTAVDEKNKENIENLDYSSSTESCVTETVTKSVPRVEVHDEVGELIQLDSLIIIPDEEEKPATDKNAAEQIQVETPQISKDSDSSESFKYATLPLTDTEWDWGADNTVLDDCILDDCRSQRTVNVKNPRTLSGPKVIHDAKNITAISSHVCGRTSPTIAYANATDHFEFADEGEQDAPVNPISTRNDGYMEFVDDEYLDYSPDNDRSMTYILKKSDICPTVTKTIAVDEDLPAIAQDCNTGDMIVNKDLCKLSNTKSEPTLSSSLVLSQEKVKEIKRERDEQTEVVRRLVLDRLGKSPSECRKSYRRPRQLPSSNPPPVPPPLLSEPLVPDYTDVAKTRPKTPLEEPKHNRIIGGLTNLFSKITSINQCNSTGALNTEAPPVPPLPLDYCQQTTSAEHQRHSSADQQAAAVAELMQVSAQRDAHSAMLAADRRRKRQS